jgi:membrane fusion protein, copper/silver efflux system
MKKKYLISFIFILLIAMIYLFFVVRHDMNMKAVYKINPTAPPDAVVTTVPVASSASSRSEDNAEKDRTATVEIDSERQQMIGIKTLAATVKPMKKTLRTVGRVEFDERKLTTVNCKVEGWIDRLYANYTGQYIRKGELLAEIYSPELLSTQLEYLNLLQWKPALGFRYQRNVEISLGDRFNTFGRLTMNDLDPLVDVFKQKLALWDISEEQIKEIETSKKPMRTIKIKSPASGYIFQKPVFKGTRVAPGDKIFDIVDLSTIWILADIYEYEIPFVKVGQNAKITLSYYPGKEFTAKVDFIYPSLSGQTRTAKARFVIPNPNLLLKPQMFANIEMELNLGERFAIPETAVLDTGTRQIVYVDMGDGYFAAQQIKTGERANGMVEVLSGLKDGEKVASSAVFLIDSEAKLKGVGQ